MPGVKLILSAQCLRELETRKREHVMKRKNIIKVALAFSVLLSFISVQHTWSQYTEYQDRPIQLGTSGGNIKDSSTSYCCSGTLGALVQGESGHQHILSNNHVLARTNKGVKGNDIIQPGLADQGCVKDSNNAVADLSRWVSISFTEANVVDAALARVRTGQVGSSILGIGEVSKGLNFTCLRDAGQEKWTHHRPYPRNSPCHQCDNQGVL